MKDYDVIVVVAELSDLSTGEEFVEEGKKVLLLEKQKVIGGRTSFWNENGMEVESGFIGYVGFYEHFPAPLEKAGIAVDTIVAWEDEAEIRLPRGQPSAVSIHHGRSSFFRHASCRSSIEEVLK